MVCYACGASLASVVAERGAVSRGASCPSCGRDVRVCRNCKFYDPSYHNECREANAERVVDKEKANFCDYYRLRAEASSAERSDSEKFKKDFDSLFKK